MFVEPATTLQIMTTRYLCGKQINNTPCYTLDEIININIMYYCEVFFLKSFVDGATCLRYYSSNSRLSYSELVAKTLVRFPC